MGGGAGIPGAGSIVALQHHTASLADDRGAQSCDECRAEGSSAGIDVDALGIYRAAIRILPDVIISALFGVIVISVADIRVGEAVVVIPIVAYDAATAGNKPDTITRTNREGADGSYRRRWAYEICKLRGSGQRGP